MERGQIKQIEDFSHELINSENSVTKPFSSNIVPVSQSNSDSSSTISICYNELLTSHMIKRLSRSVDCIMLQPHTSGPDQKKTNVIYYVEKVKVDHENSVLPVVFISFDRTESDKIDPKSDKMMCNKAQVNFSQDSVFDVPNYSCVDSADSENFHST